MKLLAYKYTILTLFAVLYFIGELALTVLLFSGGIGLFTYFFLHTLGVLCTFALYPLYLKTSSPFIPIFGLLNATLGVFGSFFTIMILLQFGGYRFIVGPLSKMLEGILPRIHHSIGDVIYERVRYGLEFSYRDTSAIPFNDVMHYGSTDQKIAAIGKILRFFTPKFSEALRLAAEDKQGSVRVMAATAISHLDERYYKKYQLLKKEVEEAKDKKEPLLRLAKHAEEYARCSFFDRSRCKKMEQVAIHSYKSYLELDPLNEEIRFVLATLLSGSGDPKSAEEILEEDLKKNLKITREGYEALMNAYLLQKKYDKMYWLTETYFDELTKLVRLDDPGDFEELFHTWSLSLVTETLRRDLHG